MLYEFVGWCKEGIHDKVWGIIELYNDSDHEYHINQKNKYIIFWGRRGDKLRTKLYIGAKINVKYMAETKIKRGYVKVEEEFLHKIYPEFKSDLEKTVIWESLKI